VHLEESVEFVDLKRRYVKLNGGHEEPYDYLVSTVPLPIMYRMLKGAPDTLKQAAQGLGAISVLNINIGVDRPEISDQHWIYFPEDHFIFSRIGFPMNFSSSVSPEGASSIYIEITHEPGEPPDLEQAYARSISDLQKCGILRTEDRILTRHVIDIRYAYVVFDRHRQTHLQRLLEYLESLDIFMAGRYGRWDYYSMEDSILSGKTAAEKVLTVCQPQSV
jgi:UDP-galactopyranose mutase